MDKGAVEAARRKHSAATEDLVLKSFEAGYVSGHADAKKEIMALLTSGSGGDGTEPQDVVLGGDSGIGEKSAPEGRKRAPKGLPKALTIRVLKENELIGTTPQEIIDSAETEYEKMIAVSSIRNELRKGEKEGHYFERDGLWFLKETESEVRPRVRLRRRSNVP